MIRERNEVLGILEAKPTLIYGNKDQEFMKIPLKDTGIKEATVRVIYLVRKKKKRKSRQV